MSAILFLFGVQARQARSFFSFFCLHCHFLHIDTAQHRSFLSRPTDCQRSISTSARLPFPAPCPFFVQYTRPGTLVFALSLILVRALAVCLTGLARGIAVSVEKAREAGNEPEEEKVQKCKNEGTQKHTKAQVGKEPPAAAATTTTLTINDANQQKKRSRLL